MQHDPADKTHRKPRQFRNTPSNKYVNGFAAGVTLVYMGVMYYSLRKNVFPYLNTENNQITELSEDEKAMAEDYSNPVFKNVIDRLRARKEERLKAEAELRNIQTN